MLQPLEKLEEIEAYSKQLFSDQQKESFAKRISVTTIRTSATAPCVKKIQWSQINHFLPPIFL